jgi:E3 ubiquitin-protein ligase UBR3
LWFDFVISRSSSFSFLLPLLLFLYLHQVLLVRKKWSIYWPSIYVDEYGEEDRDLRRGMPLSLSQSRIKALWEMYESGNLANVVVGKRMHMERVLREEWY